MGAFAAYTFSAGIFLLVSYLVYKWLLSSENQPTFNRMALLSLYVLAFVMPLAPAMRLPARHVVEEAVSGIDIGQLGAAVVEEAVPTWPVVLLWVYVAGMLVATLMLLVAFIRLLGILRRGRRMSVSGYTLIVLPHTALAPFSWMKYIVMSEADYAAAHDMIVLHEVSHLRLCHWVDLLIAQLVVIVLWYNPASWLMRTELRNVHEYQADSAVLRSGADARQYQLLLIKKAVGVRFQSLANSPNHSKLKKRITMMYNSRTSTTRRLRALVLVPALGGALLVTNLPAVAEVFDSVADTDLLIGEDKISENRGDAQVLPVDIAQYVPSADKLESVAAVNTDPEPARKPQKEVVWVQKKTSASELEKAKATDGNLGEMVVVGYADNTPQKSKTESDEVRGKVSDDDRRVYDVVETPPSFPGGQTELMKLIAQSVRYPADAYRDSVQGRVVMQFVVDKDGKVTSPTVVRGVCESIDEEAKRVVMQLPDFIPGKLRGEPVAVRYTLPILFKLTNKKGTVSRCAGSQPINVNEAIASGVTVLVDGKKVDRIDNMDPKSIQSIDVIKTDPQYPKGLIRITLKDGSAETTTTDAE